MAPPVSPPPEDGHQCAWREYAEALEARMKSVEDVMADAVARIAELEQRAAGHKSEKLPPLDREIKKQRASNPEKALETRRARGELKARLVEERIAERVPDAQRCCSACGGTDLRATGTKESTVYEYVSGYFRRQVHVRETLRCPCGEYIVTAPAPDKSTDRTRYGPGFIAHLLTAKCSDSLPLYRLEKAYKRLGISIARSTMCDLFHRNAELLAPLSARLLQIIATLPIVQGDEASMRRLDSKKKAYLWTFLGYVEEDEHEKLLVGYRFSPDRSGRTPSAVLGTSVGTLIVDAYTGYNDVTTPEKRERAGCLAHARRKLFAAMPQAPDFLEALEIIRDVYVVEHDAKERGVARTGEHTAMRQARSRPLMEKLRAWLEEHQGLHPPKSLGGTAIRYALNNWTALTRFLNDARIPPDNNRSEAALRVAVLGRKNYLFVGNEKAGENIAGVYALVATCEANGVNPLAYLRDVLLRVSSHPADKIDDLLPHRWVPGR